MTLGTILIILMVLLLLAPFCFLVTISRFGKWLFVEAQYRNLRIG